MRLEFATNEKLQANVHYVNTPVPSVVEENFGDSSHDRDDLSLAEVLQDQETLYQSLQKNSHVDAPKASSSANSNSIADQCAGKCGNSKIMNLELQLAIDEALARELQEVEDQLAVTSLSEAAGSETDNSTTESPTQEGSSAGISSRDVREDDVDPDNMSYEELQSLTEAVGTASRGLSDELISYLPSSTYKTGFFSKNDISEECVICYEAYKNREKLITLPCQHQYHKSCIIRWLKDNKACPVCKDDVFG